MNTENLLARGAAIGFFAGIFRPGIDLSLLRRCAAEHMFEHWPLPVSTEDATRGLAVLRSDFAAMTEEGLAAIERDNTALLIGPEQPVPMWESVWRTEERLLFGDCTYEVREAFARSGFATPLQGREPDDHLSLELSFLAALIVQAGQSLEAEDPVRAQALLATAGIFYEDHTALWAFDCLREVGRQATTGFYRSACLLCADTLNGLREIFGKNA